MGGLEAQERVGLLGRRVAEPARTDGAARSPVVRARAEARSTPVRNKHDMRSVEDKSQVVKIAMDDGSK